MTRSIKLPLAHHTPPHCRHPTSSAHSCTPTLLSFPSPTHVGSCQPTPRFQPVQGTQCPARGASSQSKQCSKRQQSGKRLGGLPLAQPVDITANKATRQLWTVRVSPQQQPPPPCTLSKFTHCSCPLHPQEHSSHCAH